MSQVASNFKFSGRTLLGSLQRSQAPYLVGSPKNSTPALRASSFGPLASPPPCDSPLMSIPGHFEFSSVKGSHTGLWQMLLAPKLIMRVNSRMPETFLSHNIAVNDILFNRKIDYIIFVTYSALCVGLL